MLTSLLRVHLKPYRGVIVLIVALQAAQAAANLYLPSLNADIIDDGVARGDTDYILGAGGWMLAVSFGQVLAVVAAVYLGARTAMRLGRDLRQALFDRVMGFSAREVARFGPPSLITRNTNDVQQVQMLVLMTLVVLISAPMMMVGAGAMALRHDVVLSGLILVILPVVIGFLALVLRRMSPLFRAMQKAIDVVNQVLREQIDGSRVIRAFVRQPYEEERFDAVNRRLTKLQLSVGYTFALMFPFMMLLMNLTSVAVLWFGGHRVESGAMEVGGLTAFITYLMLILMSVMMASMMFFFVPRAQACAERIQEVLRTETTVRPPADPVFEFPQPGRLRLVGAWFQFQGAEAPVLRDISFEAVPGQVTAIIGATGSGKTTLVNLIPRLFDATAGRVEVGGVDVKDLDPQTLWGAVGFVPQQAYLFSGTVRSNLEHGRPDASDEELWQALEIAQAADFVRESPDGLDAEIVQGGTNLSGGQRQRLSIARAVIRRPALYVFDDAFSALDFATDARLRAALRPITRDSTVVLVAQRVGTIMEADQILVLESGRVVGAGRHRELLETCPTYREIVESQMSLAEAA
ncbi:MAG: ABC transporter ATP-binding protein/permease [Bifidobacteriaceae bacterium]|jgi:ATP-binding cassette subfamily B protein|nr:ABC transporter ATP-binding protein/permease [Bifidobacteriaceae bacterium]